MAGERNYRSILKKSSPILFFLLVYIGFAQLESTPPKDTIIHIILSLLVTAISIIISIGWTLYDKYNSNKNYYKKINDDLTDINPLYGLSPWDNRLKQVTGILGFHKSREFSVCSDIIFTFPDRKHDNEYSIENIFVKRYLSKIRRPIDNEERPTVLFDCYISHCGKRNNRLHKKISLLVFVVDSEKRKLYYHKPNSGCISFCFPEEAKNFPLRFQGKISEQDYVYSQYFDRHAVKDNIKIFYLSIPPNDICQSDVYDILEEKDSIYLSTLLYYSDKHFNDSVSLKSGTLKEFFSKLLKNEIVVPEIEVIALQQILVRIDQKLILRRK